MELTPDLVELLNVALNEATLAGSEVSLEDFAAGGKRWWDALFQNDPRTLSSGIVPLTSEQTNALEDTLG